MIDLVLVKRNMLRYVRDVRAVRGMGCGLSDHYVVLCKVRLVGTWTRRREVVVGARRIRREKLREHQYREGYARFLEGKGVEWDPEDGLTSIEMVGSHSAAGGQEVTSGSMRSGTPKKKLMKQIENTKSSPEGHT